MGLVSRNFDPWAISTPRVGGHRPNRGFWGRRQRRVGVVGDVDAGDDENALFGGHFRNLHDKMTLWVKTWTFFSGLRPRL